MLVTDMMLSMHIIYGRAFGLHYGKFLVATGHGSTVQHIVATALLTKESLMKYRSVLIFATLALWAVPSVAEGADPDVQCLTLSKFFAANEKDPTKKLLATASTFFFLGRVDARLSADQLKSLISAPSGQIKKTEAGGLMTACAKRLQGREQALMSVGRPAMDGKPK